MAGLDRIQMRERLGSVVGLPGVEGRDLDESRQRLPDRLGVDHGPIAGDRAPRLEPLQPGLRRRYRQADDVGEMRERRTTVAAEFGDHPPVDIVFHEWKNT